MVINVANPAKQKTDLFLSLERQLEKKQIDWS